MKLEDIRKIVESDKETKKLKVSDSDLFLVYTYIQQRDNKLSDAPEGYKIHLSTTPYLNITYVPSIEIRNAFRKSSQKKLIKTFDSLNYILDVELKDFKVFNLEREKVMETVQNFVEIYERETRPSKIKGLYIQGKYGTGKTFLVSGIANALVDRGVTVLFVYMPDLVRMIRSGFDDNSIEAKVNDLKTAPVLILDDFGGEYLTAWFRDEILAPVLEHRRILGLPVIISTNLSMSELVEHLSLASNSGKDTMRSARIITRIKEITTNVLLTDKMYSEVK